MISADSQEILNISKRVLGQSELYPPQGAKGLGHEMSERCIETPWVASHFNGEKKVLDVGYTMSSLDYLGLLMEMKIKHGVEIQAYDIIKPERVQNRYPKEWLEEVLAVPVTLGDFRTIPLPADTFDLATCISTIEHIGFDSAADETNAKTAFDRAAKPEEVPLKRDPQTDRLVLNQFHKALKKGGKLLVSVPMGKGGPTLLRDSLGLYCNQWEYEANSWRALVSHEGFTVVDERFFIRTPDHDWRQVSGPADLVGQSSYLKPFAEGCAIAALKKI